MADISIWEDQSESITEALKTVVDNIDGVEAVVVSNLYGLPLLRVASSKSSHETVEQVETLFAHVFYTASELVDRLPTGATETITSIWEDLVLVQSLAFPLAFAIVGNSSCSIGSMHLAAVELRRVLEPVRRCAEANSE